MRSKPKKRLGQHFLSDKNIQRKIIQACSLNPTDIILEIGAGHGELTADIARRVKGIVALELDRQLYGQLKEKFKDYKNIKILNQDVLKFNFNKYFPRKKIKVVGNIPYYITTPIIEHLFRYKNKIEMVYLSVQKEFAKRIIAPAGSKDYGAFSCFVQYFSEPKIIFTIKKNSFFPAPKVNSCFLSLRLRPQTLFRPRKEQLLFRIIRAAFNQRRKTLRNSLKDLIARQRLETFFAKYAISSNARPETLALKDFANLVNT